MRRTWILASMIGALALFGLWRVGPSTRSAIRVDCAADPRACELAEAVAVDVWSEERGAGLPLDVVVTPDGLTRLSLAGVAWEVLVDDIDAAARDESMRMQSVRPGDWFAEF